MKNLHVCRAQLTYKSLFCFGGFLHINVEYDGRVKIEIFINFS